MNERAVRRATLPLTARDVQDLDALREAPEYGSTVAAALGLNPNAAMDVTESVLLHFIFTRGLQSLKEEAEKAAYDRVAKEQQATEALRDVRSRTSETPVVGVVVLSGYTTAVVVARR